MKNLTGNRVVTHLRMSAFTILILPILFMAALPAEAQRSGNFITAQDLNADITPRITHDDATYGMTTQEGSVDLMLTEDSIVIQFTDRFLDNLDKDIRGSKSEDPHLITVIRSMVSTGVSTLLDRALAIPLEEISEVYYEDGTLTIISRDGEKLFDDLDVDGYYVMEDFARRDARRFVRAIEPFLSEQ